MRIVIQLPDQSGYYDGADWNGVVEQAQDFGSVAKAEAFCRENAIKRALIVVKFKDSAHDIRYSVGARNALLVSKPPTSRIQSLT